MIVAYQNGGLITSFSLKPLPVPVFFSDLPLIIGTSKDVRINSHSVSYFTGQLDDIFLYNRALSQDEIIQIYEFAAPTSLPSSQPSNFPTAVPSGQPTGFPSCQPSSQPTGLPSTVPTTQPSRQPSGFPSGIPTGQPTSFPSNPPSGQPTCPPSNQPSTVPSCFPSIQPTGCSSGQPTGQPTTQPTNPLPFPRKNHPLFQPVTGFGLSLTCHLCDPGQTSQPGGNCTLCEVGYSGNPETYTCEICVLSFYSSSRGQAQCKSLSSGTNHGWIRFD
jgi:hypothetical protein